MGREGGTCGADLHSPEVFETSILHLCNPAVALKLVVLVPVLLLRGAKSQSSQSKRLHRVAGARSMEMK